MSAGYRRLLRNLASQQSELTTELAEIGQQLESGALDRSRQSFLRRRQHQLQRRQDILKDLVDQVLDRLSPDSAAS